MAIPRRRLVRSAPTITETAQQHQLRRSQKLRTKLSQERAAFGRWMSRLKRAFNAMVKAELRIARLEKQLAPREDR